MDQTSNAAVPRRAGLRAQQKASTRARLKAAAIEVFAAKGYAAATVEEIAGAAGASPATFYLHFGRKIDVLIESVADEAALIGAAAGTFPPDGEEFGPASVRRWVDRLFDSWQELRVLQQVLGQARLIEPELQELQRARLREGIDYWDAVLADIGMASGKPRRAEAALLNSLFVGLFETWIVSAVPLDRVRLIDRLTDLLWNRMAEVGDQRDSTTTVGTTGASDDQDRSMKDGSKNGS